MLSPPKIATVQALAFAIRAGRINPRRRVAASSRVAFCCAERGSASFTRHDLPVGVSQRLLEQEHEWDREHEQDCDHSHRHCQLEPILARLDGRM